MDVGGDSLNQIGQQNEMDAFSRSSLESVQALDHMKRRSSSRSIKRRKFDDELVESSLNVSSTAGFGPKMARTRTPSGSITPSTGPEFSNISVAAPLISTPSPFNPADNRQRRSTGKTGSNSRRNRKVKQTHGAATKDLGRWKPTDDLALITAVQQTNDLRMVHRGVKFSCRFTIQEVQQRWYALLYDPAVSRLAVQSMRNLHPEVIANVESKALYSKAEEELLATVKVASQPTAETFQDLLQKNPQVFYHTRTPKSLLTHWHLMKQYHLLPDQTVQSLPRGEHVINFSDAEDMLNDTELAEIRDGALEQELSIADRRSKKEIRTLENELGRWQVLVDSVTGVSPPDFDNQTLAVLRGRLVRYLMRSREITIGRSTRDHTVDVDLTLEGPAWKVSRRQGTIRLRNNGDFYLASEGKRAIYVDGRPILAGNKYRLNNNSVVEGPAWKVSRRQGTIRLRNNGDFYLASEGKRAIYVDGRPILAGNKYRLNNNSVVEITIGRSTRDHTVDVDLTLEGPAWKVSKRQGTIRLRNNGDFYLASEGKRAIYVDGRPILAGNKYRLNNNSVVEITIGRSTRDHTVDVDLTLEGPAWKVSRRQGTIRLRNNGDFYLASEGKRAIYVDGRPILAGNKYRLNNNSVVEIANLRFIFLVNQDLISVIRQEAAKLNLQP